MIATNKILLPVALAAALIGGSVGALVTHSHKTAEPDNSVATTNSPAATSAVPNNTVAPDKATAENSEQARLNASSSDEQTAYRNGFNEGVRSARGNSPAIASERVVNRTRRVSSVRPRYSSAPQRAYYDYGQPRSRSFWQKHRDKLTVAMGTGGGALLGRIIGGGKGAAIGALAGAGGSALYTYKIRHRNRRY